MNIINVGLFAHVDAGKTTIAEHILYNSGLVKEIGNVNNNTSNFDYDEVEKKRGITIFSQEARINWKGSIINIIDTPGHIDFSWEIYRTLKVVDVAVLIISAVESIQSHTETIWNLLRKENIPTLLFINKMDMTGARAKRVKEDIKKQFTKNIFYPFYYNNELKKYKNVLEETNTCLKNDIIELVVPTSEELMEKYFVNKLKNTDIAEAVKSNFSKGNIFSVIEGSAVNNIGIKELLDLLTDFYIRKDNLFDNLKAYVYKIKSDPKAGKLTYIKILSGEINVRDPIILKGEENKVIEIRQYIGVNYTNCNKLSSGDIGAVAGIKNSLVGDIIGEEKVFKYNRKSILKSSVYPLNEDQRFDLINALKILNEEEPKLNFTINEVNNELTIDLMGVIQIEVLEDIIKRRFNIEVKIDIPRINYLETIKKITRGLCHYEPKKHFGEVEVEIEPLPRGEGIKYSSLISTDILPSQYQNIIEKSVDEAVKHGIIINAPITDLHIKLINGKYHLKHTHGGDFRIAFIRALNKALEDNEVILLEPLFQFQIKSPEEYVGKIMTDVLKYKGNFEEPTTGEHYTTIKGQVPVSKFLNYPVELASFTKGKANIYMKFIKYKECHNSDEVRLDIRNHIQKDEKLYNSISLLREKKKMKKI